MSSSAAWSVSELGKEAVNASRPFRFDLYSQVVFVNTGDVLGGKVLHSTVSPAEGLPGQAKKALRQNDILLTEIRPANGRFAFVDFSAERHVVSTKFMVIESRGRLVPKFLYHVLTNQFALDEFQRIAESRSGTFPQITFDSISHFPVPVPPADAQASLIHFLDTVQSRLELFKDTIATLDAIAHALFKSWFVDFDLVRTKKEGRAPDGLETELSSIFPDDVEQSEWGAVPRGWTIKPLDQIAHYLNGLALQKFPPSEDDWLPAIKIAQLRQGDTGGADRVGANLKPQYIVNNGDVLFSWSGSLEVEIWCGGRGALNQHLFKVTSEKYPKWFYYLWTRHHLDRFRQIAASKATTMGHIQRSHLSEAKALCPPDAVIRRMDRVMAPLIDRGIEIRLQAQTLASLRDTLLPRLISGQLRLPDAERLVDAMP